MIDKSIKLNQMFGPSKHTRGGIHLHLFSGWRCNWYDGGWVGDRCQEFSLGYNTFQEFLYKAM